MSRKGELLPARKVLESLVKAAPQHFNGRFNLALVYDALGLRDSAINAYREVLIVNPTDPVTHFNLARLLGEEGQFGEAIQHCDVCIEACFERARASFYKARSLTFLDRGNEALQVLRSAAQMEKHSEPLWFALAEFEERAGNRAEALQAASHCRRLLIDSGEQCSSKFGDVERMLNRLSR